MSRRTMMCIVGYAVVAGMVLRVTGVAENGPETYASLAGVIIVAVWGVLWDAQEGP